MKHASLGKPIAKVYDMKKLFCASVLLTVLASISGCVVAPPRVVVPAAVVVPPGVVYVAPAYTVAAPGYVWVHHPHFGWGGRHPTYGWHRGWR